jgi:hypothetical protein
MVVSKVMVVSKKSVLTIPKMPVGDALVEQR